jgi:hypothetical protein
VADWWGRAVSGRWESAARARADGPRGPQAEGEVRAHKRGGGGAWVGSGPAKRGRGIFLFLFLFSFLFLNPFSPLNKYTSIFVRYQNEVLYVSY